MEHVLHTFWHCFVDSLKIVPFLFLTYLFMEWLEHHSHERTEKIMRKADKAGPVLGALLGLVPQCGFSAAASSLYAGHVVSAGTLMAVFLATSDEMVPVFLSRRFGVDKIAIILVSKFVFAMIAGFIVDLFWKTKKHSFDVHCEEEGCHCHEKGIVRSSLFHTAKIFLFIFVFSFVIHLFVDIIGEERLALLFSGVPVVSNVLAAFIALIPNCAASVIIAELFLDGILSAGAMMSGLFVGAGTGLLVLFRVNRDRRNTLFFLLLLFVIGTISGILFDLIGLGAALA